MANIALVNFLEHDDIKRRQLGWLETKRPMPVGLLTLSAVLEQKGHRVQLVDWEEPITQGLVPLGHHVAESAARYIASGEPDIVGFTSRCDTYWHTLEMMRAYRDVAPGTPLILGGPQATITSQPTLQHFPFIDFIVRHEGESTFPKLLDAMDGRGDYRTLAGIAFRRDGEVVVQPNAEVIANLDAMPIASYDKCPPKEGTAAIEVGRGCPFACTYCSTSIFFGRKYRVKSSARVVSELEMLAERYGVHTVSFIHDLFTVDRAKVLEICRSLIERRLNLSWSCSARMDCVDRELLTTMKAAGCTHVFFGVETGSPRVQRLIRKNLDLDQVKPVISTCRSIGIHTTASFMVGLPDEAEEDIEATLCKVLECASNRECVTQVHLYSPHPGTPLFQDNRDRLVFTGYLGEMSTSGGLWNTRAEEIVRALPAVFSAYHQIVPKNGSVEDVLDLDLFGAAIRYFTHALGHVLGAGQVSRLLDLFRDVKPLLADVRLEPQIEVRLWRAVTALAEGIRLRLLRLDALSTSAWDAFKYDMALGYLQSLTKAEVASQPFGRVTEGSVPVLSRPCVVAEFGWPPQELERQIRAGEDSMPPRANRPMIFALTWRKRHGGREFVECVPLDELARVVLLLCRGQQTILEMIGSIATAASNASASASDVLNHKVIRSVDRLVRVGLVRVTVGPTDTLEAAKAASETGAWVLQGNLAGCSETLLRALSQGPFVGPGSAASRRVVERRPMNEASA